MERLASVSGQGRRCAGVTQYPAVYIMAHAAAPADAARPQYARRGARMRRERLLPPGAAALYKRGPAMEGTMSNDDAPAAPAHAQPPRGVNHVVLSVRDLEVSHRFWTEVIGFRCVAELRPIPGRERPKMRFYS